MLVIVRARHVLFILLWVDSPWSTVMEPRFFASRNARGFGGVAVERGAGL